jgi:hypothetical protein
MADQHLLIGSSLTLIDQWPNRGMRHNNNPPTGGILGTTHHNVATAAQYEKGDKITLNFDAIVVPYIGPAGSATFVYLKVGTQNPDIAIAAGSLCSQEAAGEIYTVTNDGDTALAVLAPFCGYALSAMTDGRYGWFWCGGTCPISLVTDLGAADLFLTDSNVGAGSCVCNIVGATTNHPVVLGVQSATRHAIGYSNTADH